MAHHLASNSKTSPDINTLSVFRDAKNLGILHITGKDTLDLINRMSTNNVIDIDPFHTTHTILTNDKGRIIDIIYVINMEYGLKSQSLVRMLVGIKMRLIMD